MILPDFADIADIVYSMSASVELDPAWLYRHCRHCRHVSIKDSFFIRDEAGGSAPAIRVTPWSVKHVGATPPVFLVRFSIAIDFMSAMSAMSVNAFPVYVSSGRHAFCYVCNVCLECKCLLCLN